MIIDHLQLLRNTHDAMDTGYGSHDSAVSYDLKHLAVSLDCTVVALSRRASPEDDPVIQGADMTAVLRTGYNIVEEKLKDLEETSREMKSEGAAEEDREALRRERLDHRRIRSQKPLQTEGSPIYASLDTEKNRDGRTQDALFIWRRAFHEFEEVEVEEESRSLKRFLPWEV
jgi:replicative DNA helicase